ncbi:unnamed protein product [Lathyrus oleraceus]
MRAFLYGSKILFSMNTSLVGGSYSCVGGNSIADNYLQHSLQGKAVDRFLLGREGKKQYEPKQQIQGSHVQSPIVSQGNLLLS